LSANKITAAEWAYNMSPQPRTDIDIADRQAETPRQTTAAEPEQRLRSGLLPRLAGYVQTLFTSSLTRRIVVLNLAALAALVTGILYLNQFRAGLIDARVESLLTQGEIIAGAIAASTQVDMDRLPLDPERLLQLEAGESTSKTDDWLGVLEFPINPERVAPILRRVISPTKTRARIYDFEGLLVIDSRNLRARSGFLEFNLPAPIAPQSPSYVERLVQWINVMLRSSDLPPYEDHGRHGKKYPEVERALAGSPASIVRVSDKGELVVSVAVPIRRKGSILGGLLLSTEGDDIDQIVRGERLAIFRVFLVAAVVAVVLSVLLASTIAGPMRRLAAAADRVRRGVKGREQIPDFADRHDEIGHLARALRDMTNALYNRIASIETFAADVAHELKNPLTSLRSAVETLPLAKTDDSRDRLMSVIQHDVRRLDRLISDISDASRLDAELQRADAAPVDLARLLETVVEITQDMAEEGDPQLVLKVAPHNDTAAYLVIGHDSRLAQVVTNLVDNARSFAARNGTVTISMARGKKMVSITVEDDGPGIRAENVERIFERFYTDRPDGEGFGNNSGLGLSISKQIVEAHRGRIFVQNRPIDDDPPTATGARFSVRLPSA